RGGGHRDDGNQIRAEHLLAEARLSGDVLLERDQDDRGENEENRPQHRDGCERLRSQGAATHQLEQVGAHRPEEAACDHVPSARGAEAAFGYFSGDHSLACLHHVVLSADTRPIWSTEEYGNLSRTRRRGG